MAAPIRVVLVARKAYRVDDYAWGYEPFTAPTVDEVVEVAGAKGAEAALVEFAERVLDERPEWGGVVYYAQLPRGVRKPPGFAKGPGSVRFMDRRAVTA